MKRESRTVARSDQGDSLTQRHLSLVDVLIDTRAELMELAVASGLTVLHTIARELTGFIWAIAREVAPPPAQRRGDQVRQAGGIAARWRILENIMDISTSDTSVPRGGGSSAMNHSLGGTQPADISSVNRR